MQYEYYRKGFSRIEREVYRAIENGLDKHEPYVSFELISMEQLNKIVKAIEYDHPELYFWDNRKIQTKIKAGQMALKLDYYWSKAEIEKNAPKIEKGIRAILGKCNGGYDTEYDRFLSIYSCMARNLRYDHEHVNSTETSDVTYAHTILGVFAKQSAVCDGISKAFKLVLERSGIDRIVVQGEKKDNTGISGAHAWNIVYIGDSQTFHVDLTWAVENSGVGKVNYDYVGLTDAQIQKDHQMKNLMDVPKCDNEEFDYYVRNKAVVRSVDELQRYLQKHANTKPFEINVRLDFTCNIKEMAQKASDYVVKHFVIAGGCVDIKVDSQYREGQNILIMTGR